MGQCISNPVCVVGALGSILLVLGLLFYVTASTCAVSADVDQQKSVYGLSVTSTVMLWLGTFLVCLNAFLRKSSLFSQFNER